MRVGKKIMKKFALTKAEISLVPVFRYDGNLLNYARHEAVRKARPAIDERAKLFRANISENDIANMFNTIYEAVLSSELEIIMNRKAKCACKVYLATLYEYNNATKTTTVAIQVATVEYSGNFTEAAVRRIYQKLNFADVHQAACSLLTDLWSDYMEGESKIVPYYKYSQQWYDALSERQDEVAHIAMGYFNAHGIRPWAQDGIRELDCFAAWCAKSNLDYDAMRNKYAATEAAPTTEATPAPAPEAPKAARTTTPEAPETTQDATQASAAYGSKFEKALAIHTPGAQCALSELPTKWEVENKGDYVKVKVTVTESEVTKHIFTWESKGNHRDCITLDEGVRYTWLSVPKMADALEGRASVLDCVTTPCKKALMRGASTPKSTPAPQTTPAPEAQATPAPEAASTPQTTPAPQMQVADAPQATPQAAPSSVRKDNDRFRCYEDEQWYYLIRPDINNLGFLEAISVSKESGVMRRVSAKAETINKIVKGNKSVKKTKMPEQVRALLIEHGYIGALEAAPAPEPQAAPQSAPAHEDEPQATDEPQAAPEAADESQAAPTEEAAPEAHHPMFQRIAELMEMGENVYAYGPSGTGKTHLAMQLAKHFGLPLTSNGCIYQPYELIGFVDANGHYHETPFVRAVRNGGVHLFDEFDRSCPQAPVACNAVLANGFIDLPNGERLYKHRDFHLFASGNTIGTGADAQYTAAQPLEAATLDRFVLVEVTYDEQVELALAEGDEELVEFIHRFRAACKECRFEHILTYRAIQRMKKFEAKFGLTDAIQMAVVRTMNADDLRSVRRNMVCSGNRYCEALSQMVNEKSYGVA